MNIRKKARAGTLESGDVRVTVEPSDALTVVIESPVAQQFGDDMKKTVYEVLDALHVQLGAIHLDDQGALDCTLRARLKTAIMRSSDAGAEVTGSAGYAASDTCLEGSPGDARAHGVPDGQEEERR